MRDPFSTVFCVDCSYYDNKKYNRDICTHPMFFVPEVDFITGKQKEKIQVKDIVRHYNFCFLFKQKISKEEQ